MEKPEMDGWAEGLTEVFAAKTKKSWPRILPKVVPVFLHLRKKADLQLHKQWHFPTPGQWTPQQDPTYYLASSLARPLASTILVTLEREDYILFL